MKTHESHPPSAEIGLSRQRVDTLYDGIFAVSMTLLILDVRLPADFHPDSNADLVRGLLGLWPKLVPYILSFYVLGARWVASIEVRSRTEFYSRAYVRCWLLYLLLITGVPFTTVVVGQYASLPAAVWLYAGNSALIALTAWRLLALTPQVEDAAHRVRREVALVVLLVSALACIALSFIKPDQALWPMLLNALAPWLSRRFSRRFSRGISRGSSGKVSSSVAAAPTRPAPSVGAADERAPS